MCFRHKYPVATMQSQKHSNDGKGRLTSLETDDRFSDILVVDTSLVSSPGALNKCGSSDFLQLGNLLSSQVASSKRLNIEDRLASLQVLPAVILLPQVFLNHDGTLVQTVGPHIFEMRELNGC